jgi:hypothetical protein
MVVALAGVPETRSPASAAPPLKIGDGAKGCAVWPVSVWFWLVLLLMLFMASVCAVARLASHNTDAACKSLFMNSPGLVRLNPSAIGSGQTKWLSHSKRRYRPKVSPAAIPEEHHGLRKPRRATVGRVPRYCPVNLGPPDQPNRAVTSKAESEPPTMLYNEQVCCRLAPRGKRMAVLAWDSIGLPGCN